jgi:mono/diheme cytochrome c family protein
MPTMRLLVLPSLLGALVALAVPRTASAADDGEKVYRESCTSCHTSKQRPLDTVHMSREKWKDAVERMDAFGAEIPSGKKLDALLDYLVATHGPEAAPAK